MSNFSDDFKHIVGTLAPTVATALGGPFAGAAVAALAKALGLTSNDPKAVEDAVLQTDPADLAKVRIAELDLQKTLKELGIQETQLAYADTDSARKREISVKDRTPSILAYGVTVGFFGVLAYLVRWGKPDVGGDVMLVMVGALGTAWANIISYFFGSSSGSAVKNDLINSLSAKK